MTEKDTVTVRMFGFLDAARKAEGLPSTVEVSVPDDGTTAEQIAEELGLDLGIIEGVFVNGTVYDIEHAVAPGDRIAFVPHGTPGPHRFFLGLYKAGKSEHAADEVERDSAATDADG
jgi:hypothetical protein